MSRSYKKFPVCKDSASDACGRSPKNFANRAVRRSCFMPTGKAGYKKLYCNWCICDYRFYECRDEKRFKALWENGVLRYFGDEYAEALNFWKKYYIRK